MCICPCDVCVCETCLNKCLNAWFASLCESEFLHSGSRAAAACEAMDSGHQSHQHTEQGRNPTSIHVTLQHIKHTLICSSLLFSVCTASEVPSLFPPQFLQLILVHPNCLFLMLTDSEFSYPGFWFRSSSSHVC